MGTCPDANEDNESKPASFDGVGSGFDLLLASPLPLSVWLLLRPIPSFGELVSEDELELGSCWETSMFRDLGSSFSLPLWSILPLLFPVPFLLLLLLLLVFFFSVSLVPSRSRRVVSFISLTMLLVLLGFGCCHLASFDIPLAVIAELFSLLLPSPSDLC